MNTNELNEIVREVPRDAWPDKLKYYYTGWVVEDGDFSLDVLDSHAVLMFIGSMTAWLCGRNIEIKRQSHENSQLRYTVTACNGGEDVVSVHVELVAALAAACKEIEDE